MKTVPVPRVNLGAIGEQWISFDLVWTAHKKRSIYRMG
jgi:hypothetical protein